MDKMQEILNFRRKGDMAVRTYWQKLQRLILYDKQSDVCLPEDILFTQAIYSLNLSSSQRHLILPHFENTGSKKYLINLRSISLKLSGAYQSATGGILMAGEESVGQSEESNDEAENDTWFGQARPKKKTNPGYEQSAVGRSANVLSVPNAKYLPRSQTLVAENTRRASTGAIGERGNVANQKCLRCGSGYHFWMDCPHPFRPDLLQMVGTTTMRRMFLGN